MSAIESATPLSAADIVDLRELSSAHLDGMLDEEVAEWRERFDWDFRPSADLVRRFVDQQALAGFALMARGTMAGYCYSVHDEHKGLVGDLYVRRGYRGVYNENRLLSATLDDLMRTPGITRIETQLMLIPSGRGRLYPASRYLSVHERVFMRIEREQARALPQADLGGRIDFEPWSERHQEAAARMIPESYRGHIDGRINDQYHSTAGARRFLHNIVQYPGCGSFFRPGSFAAIDRAAGQLCGLTLTSLVARDTGHITQICVAPEWRGQGIGYELLRLSLDALGTAGCRGTSLTVTSSNARAIALYESAGFATVQQFCAFVWEGFTGR